MNKGIKRYLIGSELERFVIHANIRPHRYHWVSKKPRNWYLLKCECGYSAMVRLDESSQCLTVFCYCSREVVFEPAKELWTSIEPMEGCKCKECRPELDVVLKLLPQPIYEEVFACVYR